MFLFNYKILSIKSKLFNFGLKKFEKMDFLGLIDFFDQENSKNINFSKDFLLCFKLK